jgi:trimeric autotransporter adhesin
LSPLLRYALGANSPTDSVTKPALSSTATTLSLTAVVRTDDPALTVGAEAVNDLAGTWGTGGTVNVTTAADQSGVPAGSTRKVFTVDTTGAARKFLRLTATLAP